MSLQRRKYKVCDLPLIPRDRVLRTLSLTRKERKERKKRKKNIAGRACSAVQRERAAREFPTANKGVCGTEWKGDARQANPGRRRGGRALGEVQ